GQAATGTGKTAAFALPLLNRLPQQDRGKLPSALVLVPTRELCIQVSSAIHRYGRAFDARTLPIYGGQSIGRQISTLKRGTDIVIGTPGRVLDHLNRRTLDLSNVATVVLDEADEMLDMGFAEDLDNILEQLPPQRQTVLFSATMPDRIRRIADRHLSDPITIEIGGKQQLDADRPKITQRSYLVPRAHKVAALGRLIDAESPEAALIFCRTRDEVDQLAEALNGRGYRAASLHGGMDQRQRSRIMAQLRNRNAELLVATDVAARGLDISHLSHVINFDVPSSPESYTHRIGRVGRGGKEGVALTLAEPREQRQLKFIQRITKQKIENSRVPSSADLRARWLDLTEEAVRDSAASPSEDSVYKAVLDNLSVDLDSDQIALAAIQIAHDALS
ncbi:MAG: DEAD/DEAH box helicase, partial [Gammaproteobacteria bacterium]|nr:DEAD/DEAH box helicase [Gammaproteobacteria bacterium]